MKVLLVSVNRIVTPYPVYPLGLDYVRSAIEDAHEVRRVDLCGSADEALLVEALEDFGPDVVGLSLRNIDNTEVTDSEGFIAGLEQAVAAVRAHSGAVVVIGGAGYTLFPTEVLARVGADYGVMGEGERFAPLLEALAAGRSPAGLTGVVMPGAEGRGVELAPAPFEGVCRRRAPEGVDFYLARGGMLNLQTKRGCPFRCFYCTYPLLEGRKLRRHDPDQVAAEALALQEAGARYLFIADSVFNADHDHALAVAAAFRRAGLSIPFSAYFAPLEAPDGFYAAMAEAGCTHVEFGTDTLSPRMLATYKKSFSAEGVARTHRAAVDAGLHVAHFFVLGGPGEDAASVDETLAGAEALERTVRFFFCGIRIYPGTDLWRQAVDEGQVAADADLLEPVFYQPEAIGHDEIVARIEARANGRFDWVVGTGGEQTTRILERMYARGKTGPLWEFLIR